jgi:SAM-dependent methyltransferase
MARSRDSRRTALHPDEVFVQRALDRALARGTSEHYADAEQYDHEYRRRRDDVAFYLALAARHDGPILELGCGSGRLTLPLARAGHEVVGVDGSATMLARARTRLAQAGLSAALYRADFRALTAARPLGRRRFPLVICPFNAFQHLYDRVDVERFLAGVRAHLSPGGRFVFDVMNPDLAWLSRDPERRWGRTRYRDPRTRRWMTYSHELAYDAPLQIAFMTLYYSPVGPPGRATKTAGETRAHLTHRHFFPCELEALLHYNGFRVVRREGDFGGGPLEAGSEQQVIHAALRTSTGK